MSGSGIEVDIRLADFPHGVPLCWEDVHKDSVRTRQLQSTPLKNEIELKQDANIQNPFSIGDLRKIFNDLVADLLAHHLKGEVNLQISRESVEYIHIEHRYKLKWPGAKVRVSGGDDVNNFEKTIVYDAAYNVPASKNYIAPQQKAGATINPFKADAFALGMLLLELYLFLRKPSVSIEGLNQNEDALKKIIHEEKLILEPVIVLSGNSVVRQGESVFQHLLAVDENERLDLVELAVRYHLNLFRDVFIPVHGYDAIEWIKSLDEPEPEDRTDPNKHFNYGILKYPDGSYYSGLVRTAEIPENKKKQVIKSDDQKDDGFEDTDEEAELQEEYPIKKISHEDFPYRDGKGRLYDSHDVLVYDGEWKENRPNGKGSFHFNRNISVSGIFSEGLPVGEVTIHYESRNQAVAFGVKSGGSKMSLETLPNIGNGKFLWKNLHAGSLNVTNVFLLAELKEHKEILINSQMANIKQLIPGEGIVVNTWRRTQEERDFLEFDDIHLFMTVVPHYFHVELSTPQDKNLTLKITNRFAYDHLAHILDTQGVVWNPKELDLANTISQGAQLEKLAHAPIQVISLDLSRNNNTIRPGPNQIDKKAWKAFFESKALANLQHLNLSYTNIDKDSIEDVTSLKFPHLQTIDLSGMKVYLSKAFANLLNGSNFPELTTVTFSNHPSLELNEVKDITGTKIHTLNFYECGALGQDACKQLSNIKTLKHLKIGGKAKVDDFEALFKNLTGLESLYIGKNSDLNNVSKALKQLTNLQSLTIEEIELPAADLELILKSGTFKNLRKLKIAGVYRLEAKDIDAILGSHLGPNFPELESLCFYDLKINDEIVKKFCSSNNADTDFPKLKQLSFRMCDDFGEGAIKALGGWKPLSHVNKLSLAYTSINDDGLTDFAKSSNIAALQYLSLSNCRQIGDSGVSNLMKSKSLTQLTTLKLSKLKITDCTIAALADEKNIFVTTLEVLDLNDVEMLTEASFFHIMTSNVFKNLKVLQLADSDIDEYSFKILSESRFYRNPKVRICLYGTSNIIQEHLHLFSPSAFFDGRSGVSHLNLTDQEFERIIKRRFASGHQTKLDLRGLQGVSDFGLLWLKDSREEAEQLTKIKLHDVQLQHDYLHIISRSDYLRKLQSITIDRTAKFADSDIKAFLSSRLPNLRKFKVISANVSENAFPSAPTDITSNLEELSLINCIHLGEKGAEAVANLFPKLRVLNLTNCMLKEGSIERFAKMPSLTNLRELSLGRLPSVMPDAWKKFFQAADFSNIEKLDLSESFLDNAGLAALASKLSSKLTHLNLSRIRPYPDNNEATVDFTAGIRTIIEKSPNLKQLNLRGIEQMSNEVLQAIANHSGNLEVLNLADCEKIDANGMRLIARSPAMANLRELNIENTNMTDEVLTIMATSKYLRGLQKRELRGIMNTYVMHRKPNAL